MSVDAATVRRIAHLARIAVTDCRVPHLQGELNAMLAFVEQLSEVNVEGVEPMTSVTPMDMKKRADVVNDGEIADEVVSQRAGDPGPFLSGAESRRISVFERSGTGSREENASNKEFERKSDVHALRR